MMHFMIDAFKLFQTHLPKSQYHFSDKWSLDLLENRKMDLCSQHQKFKSNSAQLTKISSPDFMNAIEIALEGTIYNLMQEIEMDEFDCTTYPMLVRKGDLKF